MKRSLVVTLLALGITSISAAKDKPFILEAHITAIGTVTKRSGKVETDVRTYTTQIDGNPVTYTLSHHGYYLNGTQIHIASYRARWRNSRVLEILYNDDKGSEHMEALDVVGEN